MTAERPPDASSRGDDTAQRLITGLNKLAIALRSGARRQAGTSELHPTQAQILTLLAARPAPLRIGQLAAELGVSSATTSDSVTALERKGLVHRATCAHDARAVAVTLTAAGERTATSISEWPDTMLRAVNDLTDAEQSALLTIVVKMIRSLQDQQAIPTSRMCITCRYFEPDAHPGSDRPHHCRFVDAPFADSDLRLDCFDHALAAHEV